MFFSAAGKRDFNFYEATFSMVYLNRNNCQPLLFLADKIFNFIFLKKELADAVGFVIRRGVFGLEGGDIKTD